jgi:hypothetical protein
MSIVYDEETASDVAVPLNGARTLKINVDLMLVGRSPPRQTAEP